jgi:hypothetical protein
VGEYSHLSPTGLAGTAAAAAAVVFAARCCAVFRLVLERFFLRTVFILVVVFVGDNDDRLLVFSPMSLRMSETGAIVILMMDDGNEMK